MNINNREKETFQIKRYAVVMLICVVLNLTFYLIAHFGHLPVWMDMQGTVLAAIVLEPAAGLLVGLIHNFIEAIFFYDVSSIIYFGVSAAAALIAGLFLVKEGNIQKRRIPAAILLIAVSTTFISTLLTYWRSAGIPDSMWEKHFYQLALAAGVPKVLSTMFGIFVLKVGDLLISSVLVAIAYLFLPKALKRRIQKV